MFHTRLYLITSMFTQIICFESLLDNSYYSINWKGPNVLTTNQLTEDNENIILKTTNQETYQCILPMVDERTRLKNKEEFSSAKLELEFLRPLLDGNICTYRLEVFWTYELCFSKYIRQFHEEREIGKPPKVQEYFLGKYTIEKFKTDLDKAKKERDSGAVRSLPKKKKILGVETAYFEVIYEDGTICDLTGIPRRSHVQFFCHSDGKGEIYELKETSSCEYEITILTTFLCEHPLYGPKKTPVHSIDCHSVGDSPKRPLNLDVLELQNPFTKFGSKNGDIISNILDIVQTLIDDKRGDDDDDEDGLIDDDDDDDGSEKKKPTKLAPSTGANKVVDGKTNLQQKPVSHTDPYVDPALAVTPSSKQILREFLNGDYCIEGGTGYWKHEFCYNKYIRQYHDSQDGRQTIKLGNWNENKHLIWIDSNPHKKPKTINERLFLYNYYSDGEFCEESKKNRAVVVKFECDEKNKLSNAISLYLKEDKVCEYKLVTSRMLKSSQKKTEPLFSFSGTLLCRKKNQWPRKVESTLFCEIIKKADDNGLMPFKI